MTFCWQRSPCCNSSVIHVPFLFNFSITDTFTTAQQLCCFLCSKSNSYFNSPSEHQSILRLTSQTKGCVVFKRYLRQRTVFWRRFRQLRCLVWTIGLFFMLMEGGWQWQVIQWDHWQRREILEPTIYTFLQLVFNPLAIFCFSFSNPLGKCSNSI